MRKWGAVQHTLLRRRAREEDSKVTSVELFFDLVFVYAVTQLSHSLLGDLSLRGLGHTAVLLLAVWWVWVFTAWVTNWLDPQKSPVRLLIFVLMFAGLLLSNALPHAFEGEGLVFALAYVFMQLARSLFMCWVLSAERGANYRNFLRITAWLTASAVFWVAGGLAAGETRLALWLVALAIEYVSPAVGFWTPVLGRSTTADWDVSGVHMAERCGLFIIIALGESLLVTGATYAHLEHALPSDLAFASAFVTAIAMWWIYFNIGAERASEHIAHTHDPGRLARTAYTYAHLPIVAGIILSAVGDELVLAHPHGAAAETAFMPVLTSAVIFLLGNLVFKRLVFGRSAKSHLAGIAALIVFGFAAPHTTQLIQSCGAGAILIVVAVWETVVVGRRRGHDDC